MATGIEWTDETWNPTTGCDQVSPGCDNCYALTMSARLKGMGQPKYQTDGDPRTSGPGFGLAMHDDALEAPLRWRKPRKVFVNSMSDLFHPKVTDEFIARVFAVMAVTPRHTYQILTKRPKRMRALLSRPEFVDMLCGATIPARGVQTAWSGYPLRNVWLGTSVEDQQHADDRIPPLLDTPAAVRFLSCEPLLGPVDLSPWRWCNQPIPIPMGRVYCRRYGGHEGGCDQGAWPRHPQLDWVIVGGESGPGARPMHPQWARDLRDQCTAAGVPFHFKQWGAYVPSQPHDGGLDDGNRHKVPSLSTQYDADIMRRVGKKAAGRELDGRTWDEFPQEVSA